MKNFHRQSAARWLSIVLASALLMVALQPAALAKKDNLPEIDKDGLHLLKNTKVRIAYAKPGATLDKYTKVKILDCFVQFSKDWERDYNMDAVGLEGRVTNKDAEGIKKNLAEEFRKQLTKELGKKGYAVVDNTGPDVLLLRPALINHDVTAPDLMTPGMGNTWVQSAGSMTLYMELYDSATSELLARVIDPREDPGVMAGPANRVTNKAAADRIISRWANLLATHLSEVKQGGAGS
jgi:hypothetical protein